MKRQLTFIQGNDVEDNSITDPDRTTGQEPDARQEVSIDEVINQFEEIFGNVSDTKEKETHNGYTPNWTRPDAGKESDTLSSPKNFQQPPTYMFQEGCWDKIWKFLLIGVASSLIHLLIKGC